MEQKKSYRELLKDPRWQKMRLEVMARDGFACRKCNDASSTLNVHHKFYTYGKMPWDYNPSTLVTLCESCHEAVEWDKAGYNNTLKNMLEDGFDHEELNWVLSGLASLAIRFDNNKQDAANALVVFLTNPLSREIIEEANQKSHDAFAASLKADEA